MMKTTDASLEVITDITFTYLTFPLTCLIFQNVKTTTFLHFFFQYLIQVDARLKMILH